MFDRARVIHALRFEHAEQALGIKVLRVCSENGLIQSASLRKLLPLMQRYRLLQRACYFSRPAHDSTPRWLPPNDKRYWPVPST
jgi:hypothetical protein